MPLFRSYPVYAAAAIGGLIGGTIGGLFKKTKQGGATISATDGVLGTSFFGNSGAAKKAASAAAGSVTDQIRSEEHTSELQSLMRISYAVFRLKKKKSNTNKLPNKQ